MRLPSKRSPLKTSLDSTDNLPHHLRNNHLHHVPNHRLPLLSDASEHAWCWKAKTPAIRYTRRWTTSSAENIFILFKIYALRRFTCTKICVFCCCVMGGILEKYVVDRFISLQVRKWFHGFRMCVISGSRVTTRSSLGGKHHLLSFSFVDLLCCLKRKMVADKTD